jgi:hypothetical protein
MAGAASHNWLAATILDFNQYLHRRLTLESWHIHQQPDPMNREQSPGPTTGLQLPDQETVDYHSYPHS